MNKTGTNNSTAVSSTEKKDTQVQHQQDQTSTHTKDLEQKGKQELQTQQQQGGSLQQHQGVEPKLEDIQQMKKQIEEMKQTMQKLSQSGLWSSSASNKRKDENLEGTIYPFRFDDFFGERIFDTMRSSHLNIAQECMNEAQSMIDRALGLIQRAEEEESKKSQQTSSSSDQQQQLSSSETKKQDEKQISTSSAPSTSKELQVRTVLPESKLVDRGNHVQALVKLPFNNLDDIRFNYVVNNDNALLTVRGRQHNSEKQVDEFEVKFNLPANVDVSRARAKVEGENLCVTVPKRRGDYNYDNRVYLPLISSPFNHPYYTSRSRDPWSTLLAPHIGLRGGWNDFDDYFGWPSTSTFRNTAFPYF